MTNPTFTLSALFFGIFSTTVNSHGLLTVPPSKNGGTFSTPLESTSSHYAKASYGIIDKAFFDNDHSITPWDRPGEFDHILARDLIPSHPETLHPCGCNAGSVEHCAGVVSASGFGETTLGDTLTPPMWARGSTQETAWNSWANHAGGHLYMLCKKSQFDACRDNILPHNPLYSTRAEEDAYLQCVWDCFESNTLEWDDGAEGWSQKIQFQDDSCSYVTMEPATKVGKHDNIWRFTPIPDSLQVTNGGEGKCMWDSVVSFSNSKVREKFVASFGNEEVCDWGLDSHAPSDWHVFDKVKVPMDLEEGEYLLSWRWDAYMADQMWTNCADITIAPPNTPSQATGGECATSTPTKSPVKSPSPPSPVAPPVNGPAPTPVSPPVNEPAPSPVIGPPAEPTDPSCPLGWSGLLAYDSCTKYHHCQFGNVIGNLVDCPTGTLFDMDLQYCNWENLVTCGEQERGCYSNNFKDCNHPDFQTANAACHTIWLPYGSRNSCVALWGSCTNQGNDSCCEPAICHQGDEGSYGQCIISQ